MQRVARKEIETVYDQVVNISICKQNKQLNVLLNFQFCFESLISLPPSRGEQSGGKTMEKQRKN